MSVYLFSIGCQIRSRNEVSRGKQGGEGLPPIVCAYIGTIDARYAATPYLTRVT
jgi:hypothetical protein